MILMVVDADQGPPAPTTVNSADIRAKTRCAAWHVKLALKDQVADAFKLLSRSALTMRIVGLMHAPPLFA